MNYAELKEFFKKNQTAHRILVCVSGISDECIFENDSKEFWFAGKYTIEDLFVDCPRNTVFEAYILADTREQRVA